jgi:hypothetical protein
MPKSHTKCIASSLCIGRATEEDLAPYTITTTVGLTMCMHTLVITLGYAMAARDYTLNLRLHLRFTSVNKQIIQMSLIDSIKFEPKFYAQILHHQFVHKANKGDLFPL